MITGELKSGALRDQSFDVAIAKTAELTKPYFSRPNLEQPYYDINDPRYLNLPTRPYPLLAKATVGASVLDDGVRVTRRNGSEPDSAARAARAGALIAPVDEQMSHRDMRMVAHADNGALSPELSPVIDGIHVELGHVG